MKENYLVERQESWLCSFCLVTDLFLYKETWEKKLDVDKKRISKLIIFDYLLGFKLSDFFLFSFQTVFLSNEKACNFQYK